ncbi:type II toxin-antitoxin system VapC family toxin [Candidatus Uhrbacteria bacterium]|nr:type II toxin-antitoxin system VapC family toxin [Candidatus Uhrbacteria bacterium]
MENEFLADADFLIALYSKNDTNHAKALKLLERVADFFRPRIVISMLVYGEVVTILSQRVAQKTAHHFMDDSEQQGITVMAITQEIFRFAQDIFRRQRSKNVSFVDATNIALMQNKSFMGLLSFDRDYLKNGIRLFNP